MREFADLNRVAPSLVIKPAENPVNASVSIRGVGTFAFSIGVEPSVAVQVDDVPILFQARAFEDLSDIERIEVLRGPQTTLYGKSASAGLINIVTPAPSSTFTAKVSGLATTDDEAQGDLVLSGPLSDTLGFRSTVNYDNFRGNIRNLYNDEEINGRAIFSTRNKLVWKPNSRLTVDLGLDYIDGRNTTGRPFFAVDPNAPFGTAGLSHISVGARDHFGLNNRDVVNDYTTGTQYRDFAESLRGSLDLGGPTLMSITSHDKFKLNDELDQDKSAIARTNNSSAALAPSSGRRNLGWSPPAATASAIRWACSILTSITAAISPAAPIFRRPAGKRPRNRCWVRGSASWNMMSLPAQRSSPAVATGGRRSDTPSTTS